MSTYDCVKLCSLPANPKEFGRHIFRKEKKLLRFPEQINWETHWVHETAKSWLARRLAQRKEIG